MKARKRFGQHFLHDEHVINRIIAGMAVTDTDHVVEIGPGHGALTEHLVVVNPTLTVIEIDRDLTPLLAARFPSINIIHADVLRVDLAQALDPQRRWRFVGNLPYNISSPLLLKLAEFQRQQPGTFVDGFFMLQREMAERVAAQPGTKAWGRLSVMMQVQFDIQHWFDVGPESFDPPPRVWSSVIRICPHAEPLVTDTQVLRNLDKVVRAAFAGRRKTLSNSLRQLPLDWDSCEQSGNVRADDVPLSGYLELAQQLGTE